jgi:rhamnosyl/mannosyltransferase
VRVLQFGRFWRREFGGIERHVQLLMEGLGEHISVDNVAAHMDGGTEVVSLPGGRVFAVAAHGLLAGIPIAPTLPFFVRQLCRREQYNIFHLHFPDPLSQFAAGLVNQTPKLVVTWHSDIVRQKVLLRAYMPFMKRFLRRADAIVAATPAHFETSTQIPAEINPARLYVIPYGIDPARFALDAAQQAKAVALRDRYAKTALVFAVGRHVYYKGLRIPGTRHEIRGCDALARRYRPFA